MQHRRKYILVAMSCLLLGVASLTGLAEAKNQKPLSKSAEDLVRATAQYKASIQALVPIYEQEVVTSTKTVEQRRLLYEQGIIAKKDLEAGERTLADAKSKLAVAQKQLLEADQLISEARNEPPAVNRSLAVPSRGSSYSASPALMRSNGSAGWSLARVSNIQSFFSSKFGRELPISAFGQTSTHDRLGFDHHNSVDVAIHPDSAAGKTLIDYLRSNGIPFIAFRSAVPGAATGAHIHVGYASHRSK